MVTFFPTARCYFQRRLSEQRSNFLRFFSQPAIRYFFPNPPSLYDCDFPLVTSTCRQGNHLASKPQHLFFRREHPMIGNNSAPLTGSTRNLLALLASSVVFSAGCSNMSSTAPAVNSLATAATLSGKVHGGNQPVVGATVTLWFAGQGAPSILAATTTTDGTGSFSFSKDTAGGHDGTTPNWSCPSTGGP